MTPKELVKEKAKLIAEVKKVGYSDISIPDHRILQTTGKIRLIKKDRQGILLENYELSVTAHPNCCGSKILHSLSVWASSKLAFYLLKGAILSTTGNGSLQYICTHQQEDILSALKKAKFKLVQTVKNPKTNRNLLLYVYNNS